MSSTEPDVASIIKSCRDIMRKDKGLNGDLDRLPQLTWLLFLKFLDDLEVADDVDAVVGGRTHQPLIDSPYRWRDWAGPKSPLTGDDLIAFVNGEEAVRSDGKRGPGLLAYLRGLRGAEGGDRRDVVALVFRGIANRMVNGYLLRDVVTKVSELNFASSADVHTLSELYESMLREMRDAAGDSGEFYTPRPLVRAMVRALNPQIGETVLDPACGTGGFLVEAYEHLRASVATTDDRETLQRSTLFGNEAKSLPFLLAQMNLLLHGVEVPNITLGNSLAVRIAEIGDGDRVDVIVTNPPFGGEEEGAIKLGFPPDKQTAETALLFLQLIMRRLRRPTASVRGGRAAVVVPNGTLYEQGVAARIREMLIQEFRLQAVLRLPKGVFEPYTDLQTNVLFFEAGEPAEEIWIYEHPLPPHRAHLRARAYSASDGLRFEELEPFLAWLDAPRESAVAWRISVDELASSGFDLALTHPSDSNAAIPTADDVAERVESTIRLLAPAGQDLLHSLRSIGAVSAQGGVPLARFLEQRGERIKLVDGTMYIRPRVQLHFRGALLRDTRRGDEIGSKSQTVMREGDLIVSRIDARNGAMALVPAELDGAIATNDFPLFRLDPDQVDGDYLRYALFQPSMLGRYEKASRGSTNRRRLDVSTFLSLEIPLPDLPEQRRLAAELNLMRTRLQDCRTLISQLNAELDNATPAVLNDSLSPALGPIGDEETQLAG